MIQQQKLLNPLDTSASFQVLKTTATLAIKKEVIYRTSFLDFTRSLPSFLYVIISIINFSYVSTKYNTTYDVTSWHAMS